MSIKLNTQTLLGIIAKGSKVIESQLDNDPNTTLLGTIKEVAFEELADSNGLDDAALELLLKKADTSFIFGQYEAEADQHIEALYSLAAKAQAEKQTH